MVVFVRGAHQPDYLLNVNLFRGYNFNNQVLIVNMEEINDAFKKNPIAWTIFTCYCIGWISPILITIFFAAPTENLQYKKDHHSPFTGFLILSIFYLLMMLTLVFLSRKSNIYLKLSSYIGISLIIFSAIYNR
jgi:hypothetical protein